MAFTNDDVAAKAKELAKAAGDEAKWPSHVEEARAALEKSEAPAEGNSPEAQAEQAPAAEAAPAAVEAEKADATPANPNDGLAQVWQAKDGKTFAKKADAVAHNEELAKAEAPAPETLASALSELQASVEKAEGAATAPAIDAVVEKFEGDFEDAYWLAKKDYSSDKRKEMADKGQAMKDGSFPIADKADLKNAVQAYGRAKDKVAAKKHIIDRAKALDATDLLPDGWDGSTKKAAIAAFAKALGKGFRTGKGEDLQKGLYSVGCLARLIQELEYIHQETKWEAAAEGDNSTVPQELKEDIANLLNTLKNMLAEESAELFSDEEIDVYGELLEAADRPKGLDALAKSMPDSKALAKVGARNSKKDQSTIQKMHDHSVELGASCDGAEKSAPANDLAKVTAERDDLQKQVQQALPVIKDLAARLKKLEDQEVPRPGVDGAAPALRVVNKADDESEQAVTLLQSIAKSNPDAIAEALIRQAQGRPMKMDGTVR
jgi:hypothetical protein